MNNYKEQTMGTTIKHDNNIEQHITTNNNFNLGADEQQQRTTKVFTSSGLKASVGKESVSTGWGGKLILPDGIKSLKLDLFNNATNEDLLRDKSKFKIHMGIIKPDGDRIDALASLEGPPKNYKRGIINKDSEHYQLMAHLIEYQRHQEGFRVSKFYQSANKQMITIQDWSVLMWQTKTAYQVRLVMGTDVMNIFMVPGKGLTVKQRNKNCIATWYQCVRKYPPIYGNDLLKSKR